MARSSDSMSAKPVRRMRCIRGHFAFTCPRKVTPSVPVMRKSETTTCGFGSCFSSIRSASSALCAARMVKFSRRRLRASALSTVSSSSTMRMVGVVWLVIWGGASQLVIGNDDRARFVALDARDPWLRLLQLREQELVLPDGRREPPVLALELPPLGGAAEREAEVVVVPGLGEEAVDLGLVDGRLDGLDI